MFLSFEEIIRWFAIKETLDDNLPKATHEFNETIKASNLASAGD